jgi:hypothetical protein
LHKHAKSKALREAYAKIWQFYKNKTNRKILAIAQKLAEKDLQNRPLDDPRYTVFFVMGGKSYGEIEFRPYKQ